ncbi:Divergent AAA domain [Legionella donaldsonii]|uniref:Divergent AAA domain n=1 Tax=Legionella donaldsonii TaxID=45060 RepID=A0A378JBD4_9GAMM|nr:ATP-binding protein [Legionella donaldsonii]STX44291.1 Divergent AAA domain [Legionella donaldsonii]
MFNCSIHDPEILHEISSLVANNVRERKDIEYKREWNIKDPTNTILKPVCALANTTNGYIIYGIDEKSPEKLELCGISIQDVDQIKLQLENLVRDCIEPRFSGLDIAFHALPASDKHIGIVSVKRGLRGPHRDNKSYKFYARNSAGSYPMDINEIRNAFISSAHITEKIKDFIQERLKIIRAKIWPIPLSNGATVVLHIIPLSSFMNEEKYTAIQLNEIRTQWKPEPSYFRYEHWETRIILEGLLGLGRSNGIFNRYDLIWREGIIEAVSIFPPLSVNDQRISCLSSENYERMIINDIRRFLQIYNNLKQDAPFVLSISYLELNNYSLHAENGMHSFGRDSFQLTSGIIESYNVDIIEIVKPLFDCVWNCCGLLECTTDLKNF